MMKTEKIQSLIKQVTTVVSIHAILLFLYSIAHEKIDLSYILNSNIPLLLFLCLIPLITIFILSTNPSRQGVVVLLGVLPAELIFNVIARFTAGHPLSMREPALIWKIIYEGSFGVLLFLEAAGSWLTYLLLQEIHKQQNESSKNRPDQQ
jgi:uncharacterized membrane protein